MFFLWSTFSYNNVHPLSNHKGNFCIIVSASYLTDTLTRLKSIFVNYRRYYDINKLILKWTKIQLVVKKELQNNCLNCNKAEHWSSNDILYHSNVNLYCSVSRNHVIYRFLCMDISPIWWLSCFSMLMIFKQDKSTITRYLNCLRICSLLNKYWISVLL